MNERLYRSVDDRVIAGVAGGLAERMGVDPSIVRIIWALLIIASSGVFLLIYIVMAIVVPEEEELGSFSPIAPGATGPATGPAGVPASPAGAPPAPGSAAPGWVRQGGLNAAQLRAQRRAERREARAARRAQEGPGRGGVVVGIALILLGTWFMVREYLPAIDLDKVWPALLLVLGLALVVYSFGVGRGPGSDVGRSSMPSVAPPTGPDDGPAGGHA